MQSFNLTPSTFSPLHRLRFLLGTRRAAVYKTVGFGGAGYTALSLGTPVSLDSKESSTMAAQNSVSEDVRGRTQQSPLASQRAKEQSEARPAGRFGQWFPLGAKEGFSQWVSVLRFSRGDSANSWSSGQANRRWLLNIASFLLYRTFRNHQHILRQAPRPLQPPI